MSRPSTAALPANRPIALTSGDPAGIGGEITLKAWMCRHDDGGPSPFLVLDDADHLDALANRLGVRVPIEMITEPARAMEIFDRALPVLHIPHPVRAVPGQADRANASAVIDAIERAVAFAQSGAAAAVVTNPISKEVLYAAGFQFPGHTEYLAHLAGPNIKPVMMLACPALRVVLVTVHVSILNAVRSLSTNSICEVARIAHTALKRDFAIANPVLAVAGLNPHAGEGGTMGREEIDIIAPAVEILRGEGIDVKGPVAPDTMFSAAARQSYDAAVCMYHDQGLIPLKTLDMERGVNATLGLPFVRTSPDHGTAFDIAGTGKASERSLMAALRMADKMAATRRKAP